MESNTPGCPVPALIMAEMCEAWHHVCQATMNSQREPSVGNDVGEHILYSRETNWVAKKGVYPNLKVLQHCRADLFEVYCSNDSELTNQAKRQGLWAERHGLSDCDLSTAGGST